MRTLIACVLLLVSFAASAGTATVSWTNPTTYTDGTALVAADITSTTVEYGSCVGTSFGVKAGQSVVTGAGTSVVITLVPGTYCFRAATTAKGVTSGFSNVATKTIVQPAPNPPSIVDVIIAWLRSWLAHRFA
jgi:hypothetical protein